MPRKYVNLTEDNWGRMMNLIGPNRVYRRITDAENDLIRRALPIVETETGYKLPKRK